MLQINNQLQHGNNVRSEHTILLLIVFLQKLNLLRYVLLFT